jgi:hypothetical protein
MAMVARLEEEKRTEYEYLIETILKAGGYEIKKKPKTNVTLNLKNDKPTDLPPLSAVLPAVMGKGCVME